jgi:hypothetical protein
MYSCLTTNLSDRKKLLQSFILNSFKLKLIELFAKIASDEQGVKQEETKKDATTCNEIKKGKEKTQRLAI